MRNGDAEIHSTTHMPLPEALNQNCVWQVSWLTSCCRPSHPKSWIVALEFATLGDVYSSGNCSGFAPVFPFNPVSFNNTGTNHRYKYRSLNELANKK